MKRFTIKFKRNGNDFKMTNNGANQAVVHNVTNRFIESGAKEGKYLVAATGIVILKEELIH